MENVLCVVNGCTAVQRVVDEDEYQSHGNHDPVLVLEQQANAFQERHFLLLGLLCRCNTFFCSGKGNHKYDHCQDAEHSECLCPCGEVIAEELYQRQGQIGDEQCAGRC